MAAPAAAGAQAQPAPSAAAMPVPDQLTLAKLLWSTMAAVDHANRTGNYSVLRELGSPAFQAANSPQALAAAFAPIRQQRLDLADTLLFEPVYEFPPGIVGGMLRMRGLFRMRPVGVQFDLLYEYRGGWTLSAIAIRPVGTTPQPSTPAGRRPVQPQR